MKSLCNTNSLIPKQNIDILSYQNTSSSSKDEISIVSKLLEDDSNFFTQLFSGFTIRFNTDKGYLFAFIILMPQQCQTSVHTCNIKKLGHANSDL